MSKVSSLPLVCQWGYSGTSAPFLSILRTSLLGRKIWDTCATAWTTWNSETLCMWYPSWAISILWPALLLSRKLQNMGEIKIMVCASLKQHPCVVSLELLASCLGSPLLLHSGDWDESQQALLTNGSSNDYLVSKQMLVASWHTENKRASSPSSHEPATLSCLVW